MASAGSNMVLLLLSLTLVLGGHTAAVTVAGYVKGTVYLNKWHVKYTEGEMDERGAAHGYYNNSLETTGWGVLEIKAGYSSDMNSSQTNVDLMYAAGYLEGRLTAEQMWLHYQNMKAVMLSSLSQSELSQVKDFFNKQDRWARQMIMKHKDDPFWRHVSYILAQFDGLYDGYKSVAVNKSSWETDKFVVQFLNGVGDMLDLKKALFPASVPDLSKMSRQQVLQYVNRAGHCSALVKVLGGLENIFMSHSSWFTYSATNRIYKFYDFNVADSATAAKKLAFSSYPGFLESLDDFYLLGSQMVLLQTTNNVFNMSLYKLVQPQSLLAWQRVRIANMMAKSGKEWADALAMYNSGTYNNQYMVIDLKQVSLEKELRDGALWVTEQIPGLVVAHDQTPILRTGYWPSYNVPFYEEIYNKSGYPEFVEAHGTDFSYQLAPRAKIFRRDEGKVVDLQTMKDIMRYNDYEEDPYSENNPCNAICCRGDLQREGAMPDGCYDTKVSDYKMALKLQSYSISGPTLGTGLQPFSWTGPFVDKPHVGLPLAYDFNWEYMKVRL